MEEAYYDLRSKIVVKHSKIITKSKSKGKDVGCCPTSQNKSGRDAAFELGMREHDFRMISLAYSAVEKYNSETKSNFRLVNVGNTGAALMPKMGVVRHLNFKARDQHGNPNAPLMTFFTEAASEGMHDYDVLVCKCLGPTASLPKYADNHGCIMCCPGLIHHPSDGDFLGQ